VINILLVFYVDVVVVVVAVVVAVVVLTTFSPQFPFMFSTYMFV